MVEKQVGNRPEVSPSDHDHCAECGRPVREEWVSYRQRPDDSEILVWHFGGIIRTGPVEPRPDRPQRTVRDFRCPEDLGVFFHPWCAPKVKLPEKLQEEITELLAKALVADYEKTLERWVKVRRLMCTELRCQAHVASAEGRRVFTMTRTEGERLRAHEGKLVDIDVERAPAGGVEESASGIASRSAACSGHTQRVEGWRYKAS